MSVRDAADFSECTIQSRVRLGVGGGSETALDHLAVEVDDDHVFSPETVVGNAARLDRKHGPLGVERRHVAERVDGKAPTWDLHVRLPCLLLQRAVGRFHAWLSRISEPDGTPPRSNAALF